MFRQRHCIFCMASWVFTLPQRPSDLLNGIAKFLWNLFIIQWCINVSQRSIWLFKYHTKKSSKYATSLHWMNLSQFCEKYLQPHIFFAYCNLVLNFYTILTETRTQVRIFYLCNLLNSIMSLARTKWKEVCKLDIFVNVNDMFLLFSFQDMYS